MPVKADEFMAGGASPDEKSRCKQEDTDAQTEAKRNSPVKRAQRNVRPPSDNHSKDNRDICEIHQATMQ